MNPHQFLKDEQGNFLPLGMPKATIEIEKEEDVAEDAAKDLPGPLEQYLDMLPVSSIGLMDESRKERKDDWKLPSHMQPAIHEMPGVPQPRPPIRIATAPSAARERKREHVSYVARPGGSADVPIIIDDTESPPPAPGVLPPSYFPPEHPLEYGWTAMGPQQAVSSSKTHIPGWIPTRPHLPPHLPQYQDEHPLPEMALPPPLPQYQEQVNAPRPPDFLSQIYHLFDRSNNSHVSTVIDTDLPCKPFLKCKLHGYQCSGVQWMIEQENVEQKHADKKPRLLDQPLKPFRGGILADDMGLGKTIQAISLILSNRAFAAGIGQDSRKGPTLVIAPLSTLHQWEGELRNKVNRGELKVYLHHGHDRVKHTDDVMHLSDVVLTTYGTCRSEKEKNGPLFTVKWLRIILDEAHSIKTHKSSTAKACCGLNAERRWCLTGTPVQNKLEDLYSLAKFLRVNPYDDKRWWTRNVDVVGSGLQILGMFMDSCVLRRTKSTVINGKPIIELPSRVTIVNNLRLSISERMFYNALFSSSKERLGEIVASGDMNTCVTEILALIIRLRQACCHPFLVIKSEKLRSMFAAATEETRAAVYLEIVAHVFGGTVDKDKEACFLCDDKETFLPPCQHAICRACVDDVCGVIGSNNLMQCPQCGVISPIPDLLAESEEKEEDEEPKQPESDHPVIANITVMSSKVTALVDYLENLRVVEPNAKTIVFSQWTSFLDIIEAVLNKSVSWAKRVRLDGTMSSHEREVAVDVRISTLISTRISALISTLIPFHTHLHQKFKNEDIPVFLVSLKAGGLGLNLAAGNHVVLMDPWWNPAVEEQAMDRVHRLGQTKPVTIARLITSDSIEEAIIKLQEKKRAIMAATLSASGVKMVQRKMRMTIDDLMTLFE